jgi:hypothetical protein
MMVMTMKGRNERVKQTRKIKQVGVTVGPSHMFDSFCLQLRLGIIRTRTSQPAPIVSPVNDLRRSAVGAGACPRPTSRYNTSIAAPRNQYTYGETKFTVMKENNNNNETMKQSQFVCHVSWG